MMVVALVMMGATTFGPRNEMGDAKVFGNDIGQFIATVAFPLARFAP